MRKILLAAVLLTGLATSHAGVSVNVSIGTAAPYYYYPPAGYYAQTYYYVRPERSCYPAAYYYYPQSYYQVSVGSRPYQPYTRGNFQGYPYQMYQRRGHSR